MANKDSLKVISCKDLGALALPDFCPRCFWLERNFSKPPSIFPGIFNTIDALTKKATLRSFIENGQTPPWLPIPNAKRIVKGSLYMKMLVEWGGWALTGYPDDAFELVDGSYHIADYKVAKFTETQDELFPMYEIQLNGYALMAPTRGIEPVSGLTLVYCEPNEELEDHDDYLLGFTTNLKRVEIKPELLPPLLIRAREILDNQQPPASTLGCRGLCHWLEAAEKVGGDSGEKT